MDTSQEDAPSASNCQLQHRHDENTQTGYTGVADPSMAPVPGDRADHQETVHGSEAATEQLASTPMAPPLWPNLGSGKQ